MKVLIHVILHEMLPKENCCVFLNLEEEIYFEGIENVWQKSLGYMMENDHFPV